MLEGYTMALYNFHRVLISATILFAMGFSLYSYRVYAQAGGSARLLTSVISAAICAGLVGYLIYFNTRIRALYTRHPQPPAAPTGDNPMSDRLEQLTKLLAADPGDPFTTYGIALEHAKAGRHEEAVRWLDQTLGLDPQYCYAYYQKARMLSELGNPDAARTTIDEGITAAAKAGDDHAREELAALLDSLA